jgi:hypothetical protein
MLLPGPHLSLERTAVCNNMGFIAYRNNEFMFLMLGETVLQIVASSPLTIDEVYGGGSGSGSSSIPNELSIGGVSELIRNSLASETAAAASAGLVLAVSMMFSFRQMVHRELVRNPPARSSRPPPLQTSPDAPVQDVTDAPPLDALRRRRTQKQTRMCRSA